MELVRNFFLDRYPAKFQIACIKTFAEHVTHTEDQLTLPTIHTVLICSVNKAHNAQIQVQLPKNIYTLYLYYLSIYRTLSFPA